MRTGWMSLRLGLVVASALGAALLAPVRSHAALDECLVAFDTDPPGLVAATGGTIMCTDCDPKCDSGSVGTKDNECVVMVRACALRDCASGTAIKKAKTKPGKAGLGIPSSPCGSFVGVHVKLKKKGKKKGKIVIQAMASSTSKTKDKDKLTIVCLPQTGTCPTTTTTTPTTTTTTLPQCGDNVISGGETCDPPGQQSTCGATMVCNSTCDGCITSEPCNCGTNPTGLSFTNTLGTGDCGSVDPPRCVFGSSPGIACDPSHGDADCPGSGAVCIGHLICAGLYFGGAGLATPVPSNIPDMGNNITKVTACTGGGVVLDLAATSPGELGTTLLSCTRGDVDNTRYPACVGGTRDTQPCRTDGDCSGGACSGTQKGCLFGAPLPVLNPSTPVASTCIINRVVQNASGTGNCQTGEASLSLPLLSDLYLTGDLLDPAPAGIQPCPLCTSGTCNGGPNNGLACTPGSGASRPEYPTSHDCPPPATAYIGSLPIPFALSTGTQTKVGVDIDANRTSQFCTFCGQTPPGVNFANPPTPCNPNNGDADCASVTGFPQCRQHTPGAFGNGEARTISSQGTVAGSLTDHAQHFSTLVSVFCIPPSYNGIVDVAADLPGPGAVSLPGSAQLLP